MSLTMKSPVLIRSTLVSRALRISLKQRPISFLLTRDTAQISTKKWSNNIKIAISNSASELLIVSC